MESQPWYTTDPANPNYSISQMTYNRLHETNTEGNYVRNHDAPILKSVNLTPAQRANLEAGQEIVMEVRNATGGREMVAFLNGEEIISFSYDAHNPANPITHTGIRTWENAGTTGNNVTFSELQIEALP